MNCKIVRTALTVIFTTSLIASFTARAHASEQCSLERAAGKWSFTDGGTFINIGPETAVGVFELDGAGNLQNGLATHSLNGTIADETFSGTYTVNPNCTGTLSVKIFASGVELFAAQLNIVFDDDTKQIRGVFTSIVEPSGTALPAVIGLEGKKQ